MDFEKTGFLGFHCGIIIAYVHHCKKKRQNTIMVGLPRWAEKAFSLKCTEGGAIATAPDEDVNGWDYLVELPSEEFVGPAEETPPTKIAYAQIKSTQCGKHSAQIKLSNIVKACRSHSPWFIILVVADRDGRNPKFFGQHVWGTILYEGLAAVRKADHNGGALNRKRFTIKFSPEDAIDGNLVHWMRSHIEAVDGVYAEEKIRILKNIGYEDGFGIGNFTISASSNEQITDEFLGLGKGLEVTRFSITPNRFGIASKDPVVDCDSGKIFIEPQPSGVCELRIRGKSSDPSICLAGKIYTYLPPGSSTEETIVRISATPVEIRWALNKPSRLKISLEADHEYSADELWTYVQVCRWSRDLDVGFEISSNGKHIMNLHARFDDGELANETEKLALIIDALMRQIDGYSSIPIKLKDVQANVTELSYFAQLSAPSLLRLQYRPQKDDAPPDVTILLYRIWARIGDYRFGCIVRRNIVEDKIQDGQRIITANMPNIIESMLWHGESADRESQMENIYKIVLEREEVSGNALGIGDIYEIIRTKDI